MRRSRNNQQSGGGNEDVFHYEEDTLWDEISSYFNFIGASLIAHGLLVVIFTFVVLSQGEEEKGGIVEVAPTSEKKEEIEFEKEDQKKVKVKSPVKDQKVVKDPVIKEPQQDQPETDQNKEFNELANQSKNFQSNVEARSFDSNDAIGTSGSMGGAIGNGRGGDANLGKYGGSQKTQDAVIDALKWLARHQAPDGHWDATQYTKQCEGTVCERMASRATQEHNVGITGLALLAYLGAGYTHRGGPGGSPDGYNFPKVVKKGLRWLAEQQNEDGAFEVNGMKPLYNQGVATLAYAEAYGMTKSSLFRETAQMAVNYLLSAQNKYSGWGYTYQVGNNDTSVTGWSAMALKSADIAGLTVSQAGFEGALQWVNEATHDQYWCVGYSDRKRPVLQTACNKVSTEKNKNYKGHPALAGVGMMIRIFFRGKDANMNALRGGKRRLMDDLPKWKKGVDRSTKDNPIDFYYWYYGSLAMFQFTGPDSPFGKKKDWKKWNTAVKDALLPNQEGEDAGSERGSWDPIGRWCYSSGRVYSTAINALTLEVYYRYKNAFTGVEQKSKNEGN